MTNGERDTLILQTATKMVDVHRSLFGNGQPGLADRVTRNEQKIEAIAVSHQTQELRQGKGRTFWLGIAMLVLAVIGQVWTMYATRRVVSQPRPTTAQHGRAVPGSPAP